MVDVELVDHFIEKIANLGNHLPPNISVSSLSPTSSAFIDAIRNVGKSGLELINVDKHSILSIFLNQILSEVVKQGKELSTFEDPSDLEDAARDLSGVLEAISHILEHNYPSSTKSFRNASSENLPPRLVLQKEFSQRTEYYQKLIEEKLQEMFREDSNDSQAEGLIGQLQEVINCCAGLGSQLYPNRQPDSPPSATGINEGTRSFAKTVISLVKMHGSVIPAFLTPFLNLCAHQVIFYTKNLLGKLAENAESEQYQFFELRINCFLEGVSRVLEHSTEPKTFYRVTDWGTIDRQAQMKKFIQNLQLLIRNYQFRKKTMEKELSPAANTRKEPPTPRPSEESRLRYTNKELLELLVTGNKEVFNKILLQIPDERDREATRTTVINMLRKYIDSVKHGAPPLDDSSYFTESTDHTSHSSNHVTNNNNNNNNNPKGNNYYYSDSNESIELSARDPPSTISRSLPIIPPYKKSQENVSPSSSLLKFSGSPSKGEDSGSQTERSDPENDEPPKESNKFASPSVLPRLKIPSDLGITISANLGHAPPSYFGDIKRVEAEKILSCCLENSYLLRSSSQGGYAYALSMVAAETRAVGHLLIAKDENGWKFKSPKDTNVYASVEELLQRSPILAGFVGLVVSDFQPKDSPHRKESIHSSAPAQSSQILPTGQKQKQSTFSDEIDMILHNLESSSPVETETETLSSGGSKGSGTQARKGLHESTKKKTFMDTFSRSAATLSDKFKVRARLPSFGTVSKHPRRPSQSFGDIPFSHQRGSLSSNLNATMIKDPDVVLINVFDPTSGQACDIQLTIFSTFGDVISFSIAKLIHSADLPRSSATRFAIWYLDRWMDPHAALHSVRLPESKRINVELKDKKVIHEKVKVTVLGLEKVKPVVELKIHDEIPCWLVIQKTLQQLYQNQKIKITPFFYEMNVGKVTANDNDFILDYKHFKDLTYTPVQPKAPVDVQLYYNGVPYKLSLEPNVTARKAIQIFLHTYLIQSEKGLIEPDTLGLVNLGKVLDEYKTSKAPSLRGSLDSEEELGDDWEEAVESWIDSLSPVSEVYRYQLEIRKRTQTFHLKIIDGSNEHHFDLTLDLYRPIGFLRDLLVANFVLENDPSEMTFFGGDGNHLQMNRYLLTCVSKTNTITWKRSLQSTSILIEYLGFFSIDFDVDLPPSTLNEPLSKILQKPDLEPSEWSLHPGFNLAPLDMNKGLCEQKIANQPFLIFRFKNSPPDPLPEFPDFEKNIWEEPTSTENAIFSKKEFRAGTINQCIIHLTNPYNPNTKWKLGFLACSSDLLSPAQLFKKLLERYEIPTKFRERSQELAQDIQANVRKVLAMWIESFPFDFSHHLWKEISSWVSSLTVNDSRLTAAVEKRYPIITAYPKPPDVPNPPPIIMQFNKKATESGILAFNALEIARQLTIIDFELFSKIPIKELRNQNWMKGDQSPHMKKFSANSNAISTWVSSSILSPSRAKERAHRWQKFIKIAEKLRDLNNFSSLNAIIGGWNNPAITRLNFTKELISKSYLTSMEALESEMTPSQSFKEYREAVVLTSDPLVPHLPIHLQDLIFIEQGNPSSINGLFNSERRTLTFKTLEWIQSTQKNHYHLKSWVLLRSQLLLHDAPNDEKEFNDNLYRISREREPRNATRVL